MLNQRAHRLVNLKDFQTAGGPLSLGRLDLTPPTDEQYILRMVIRAEGDYQIPDELDWVMPLIKLAQEHQKAINANHTFCYVTVRHGIANSKSDDEWQVRPEVGVVGIECGITCRYRWAQRNEKKNYSVK